MMRKMASDRHFRLLLLFLSIPVTHGWLTNEKHGLLFPSSSSFRQESAKFTQCRAKFAQPAFQHRNNNTMPRQPKFGGDSKIAELHSKRVKTAGRVGTKRYVNPCKVFLGNLPFNTTESELQAWICTKLGLPAAVILNECKIIRDWKTSNSKGYGFVVFTEAIYATVCIDKCNNQLLGGRKLTVNQGQKKQSTEVYVKKNKKPAVDAEEAAIQQGMTQAEQPMDPSEVALLRSLDPDLVDNVILDTMDADDGILFIDDEDDDDNEGVDGIFVEDDITDKVLPQDEPDMNRQRRREEARHRKRKKIAKKGFGS